MKQFSVRTITALTEVITGGSATDNSPPVGRYRGGPALERFFGDLNLDLQIGSASRVPSVKALLDSENRKPEGRGIIIKVLEAAADPRDYLDKPEKLIAVVGYLNQRLTYDGYALRKIGHLYRVVALETNTIATAALKEKVKTLNFESVQRDFDQALLEADQRPAGAARAACATIESVCKSILDELNESYPANKDVQHLSNEVAKHLGLSPGHTDLPPLLAKDLKQILVGLQTIAGGVGSLRTHFSDVHGRGKVNVPIDSRIARLAIHAACTLSLFYIETWQRKNVTKTKG